MQPPVTESEAINQKQFRRGLKLIARSLKIRPFSHAIAITGACLFSISAVLLTRILGYATDDVIIPNLDNNILDKRDLWLAFALIIAVGLARGLGAFLRRYFLAGARYGTELHWRRQLFNQYLDLPMSFHRKKSPGELLAHADNDMIIASLALMPLAFTIGTFFLAIVALINLFLIHPAIALIAVVLFPLLAAMNKAYSQRVVMPASSVQESVGNTSSLVHESFDGILVVKSLGRSNEEVERLRQSADQIRKHRISVGRLRAIFEPSIYALTNLGVIALLIVGTWLIDTESLTIGELVSAIALFGILAFPVRIVGIFFEELPRSVVALDRIDEVLNLDSSQSRYEGEKTIDTESSTLRVENVQARYGNQLILDNINFSIHSGEIVGLVGPTGVGKSTIADLVGSLQQPTSGDIYLSDIPINDITPADRTKTLTIAFQESFLFADTVKENILLGRDFTDYELQEAIETSQAHEFISALPAGLHTLLGERGVTLSGGQRQRVTLARALIGNPQIIFLDDSTSSVDPVIEKRILDGLRNRKTVSLLIVAHRLSTIKLADRIIFLNNGVIEGTGAHEELMHLEAYASLVKAYEKNGSQS
jgi:ABC-type multidrug transport system fused ATPase/permease subunit